MRRHSDFLTTFRQALTNASPAIDMLTCPPGETDRRIAVYRNNVTYSLCKALEARFPVICRLVGKEFFSAMALLYIEQHGPRNPLLTEWGGEFASFLSSFAPLVHFPYMADVARIEYARGRAFHAADAVPVDPSRLCVADPWSTQLSLHPSLDVLWLHHPAVSIWEQNQPGGGTSPILGGSEIALILRDRDFEVPVRAITPGDAILIESLRLGDSLGEAASNAVTVQHNHDPGPILIQLMRQGAIVRYEDS